MSVSVFVDLCGWPHIYAYICCIVCVAMYVPVGNVCSALLLTGPGNMELQQLPLCWAAGLGTPQQNCRRADVILEFWAFFSLTQFGCCGLSIMDFVLYSTLKKSILDDLAMKSSQT